MKKLVTVIAVFFVLIPLSRLDFQGENYQLRQPNSDTTKSYADYEMHELQDVHEQACHRSKENYDRGILAAKCKLPGCYAYDEDNCCAKNGMAFSTTGDFSGRCFGSDKEYDGTLKTAKATLGVACDHSSQCEDGLSCSWHESSRSQLCLPTHLVDDDTNRSDDYDNSDVPSQVPPTQRVEVQQNVDVNIYNPGNPALFQGYYPGPHYIGDPCPRGHRPNNDGFYPDHYGNYPDSAGYYRDLDGRRFFGYYGRRLRYEGEPCYPNSREWQHQNDPIYSRDGRYRHINDRYRYSRRGFIPDNLCVSGRCGSRGTCLPFPAGTNSKETGESCSAQFEGHRVCKSGFCAAGRCKGNEGDPCNPKQFTSDCRVGLYCDENIPANRRVEGFRGSCQYR